MFDLTPGWSAPSGAQFKAAHMDHFREHWLESPWFTADGDTADYLRTAFRDALSHAMERDVEINALWVQSGTTNGIDLGYVDNPNSVTLVLHTPRGAPKAIDPRVRVEDPWSHVTPHEAF